MKLCRFGWHKWGPWEFSHHSHDNFKFLSVFVRTCECCRKPSRMTIKPVEKFP